MSTSTSKPRCVFQRACVCLDATADVELIQTETTGHGIDPAWSEGKDHAKAQGQGKGKQNGGISVSRSRYR
jgi:hypothetical protein